MSVSRRRNYERLRPPVPLQPMWTGKEPCRQLPEVFHPDQADNRTAEIAKWICKRCPSQDPCLEWAVRDPTLEGIHAGTTARQRGHMRGRAARR